MQTSLFDFTLPDTLIATQPASPRDSARLLVVSAPLQHQIINELPRYLRAGDVMVFNNTRVIPARLYGKRGEAKIELLLHKSMAGNCWSVFARPAKKLRIGDRIDFAPGFAATVADKLPSGEVVLSFAESGAEFYEKLAKHGHMPLPPYIDRKDEAADKHQYQTVYAQHDGSVAAPTAGLHFTENLLKAIDDLGVKRVYVTLHVGGGTFLPVKAEDTADHIMHSEYATITAEAAAAINQAKASGGRVIAVGTTSLRTLESAADQSGQMQAFSQETNIFITPGYCFKIVDMLLTNFHLPRSTLFMLVSAFCGLETMQAAYAQAIAQKYRFYSYGDACLLYRR